MAKDTKLRILEASLEVFSEYGYEATNIKDIASRVGLVKSGLYKHFKSKEEIYNETINMMISYYSKHISELNNNLDMPNNCKDLYKMTMNYINFTLHDKNVILMRKIIMKEQFNDEKMINLANKYFLYDLEDMYTRIFDSMIKNKLIKKVNSRLLAFSFITPISSLIHLCDRDKDKEDEVIKKIKAFIKMFINEYSIDSTENV